MSPLLSVRLDVIFGSEPPASKLERLPLGKGCGVRALTVFERGLLILAGPAVAKTGPYSFIGIRRPAELSCLQILQKPLDKSTSGLRLLVFSDGGKEGAPRPILVPAPDTAA